ncbi:MAG: hypothetical protein GF390_02490, partial [Candidatus Pacebacteria bacterium]|nr:hypothetical protein [Candidatus Paceibacterota bacterium]
YYLLGLGSGIEPDMGIAVILLTILIRILLLPLSLAGSKSEQERRSIAKKIKTLEQDHGADPVTLRMKKKLVFKRNPKVIISETINLFIQVSIALMLWKIFSTGLEGQDFHLIYSFMPEIEKPLHLMFLGKFDLTEPHLLFNIIQSILIFILETLSVYTSPYPHSKKEVVRLQLTLPIISFLIFMKMPAGKKLFVITTLIFSIILTLIKAIRRKALDLQDKWVAKQAQATSDQEQILVAEK